MIMIKYASFLLYSLVLMTGCTTLSFQRPPVFTLIVPPAFKHFEKVIKYRAGDYLVNSPPYVIKAEYPRRRFVGAWGAQRSPNWREHSWKIEVSHAPKTKIQEILTACSTASDGYEASKKVDEDGSYMFARFSRRDFRWGKAFSYLTQFTQDTGIYVPHNGHLTYEVWGVTYDGRYAVHADFDITHPKLGTWGPTVRNANSMEALKQDRDYKLVESCSSSEFLPSLEDIDALINSIHIEN
jgi:hypothetical protein